MWGKFSSSLTITGGYDNTPLDWPAEKRPCTIVWPTIWICQRGHDWNGSAWGQRWQTIADDLRRSTQGVSLFPSPRAHIRVGYEVANVKYWIATNRHDLQAEQVATAYKLRWDIENFFAWWKKHLKVYHLIARSEYGLMVQILSGLITYLLLAIHCYEEHNEKVSIKRGRQLRIKIHNELLTSSVNTGNPQNFKEHNDWHLYANT